MVRASRDHVGHGVGPAGSVEIAASGYGVAHVPAYAVDAASLMRLPDQSLLEAELDTVEILLPAQTSDVPSVNGRVRPGHALDVSDLPSSTDQPTPYAVVSWCPKSSFDLANSRRL